jgi:hypothetical protein
MTQRLSDPFASPLRLSQAVVQASEMLGLVRAEMGRILGFKCAEFSALFEGRSVLQEGTEAWEQGVLFVRFYQALYEQMGGDGPRMINWMRRQHQALGNSPFYLIIDEGRLAEVVAYLAGEA